MNICELVEKADVLTSKSRELRASIQVNKMKLLELQHQLISHRARMCQLHSELSDNFRQHSRLQSNFAPKDENHPPASSL